jgi:uncharacterized membrane protein YtjA (UPF0391 family)
MLGWAAVFLVIAVIAALLGVSGVATLATAVAWILSLVGLALALIFVLLGRRPPY